MSDNATASPFGWEISARPAGDVLAARARGHGVELMLLSRVAGHDPTQIEGWLAELIGVAVETSRKDATRGPVSALLRHTLTGLLFSHAELWLHTPEDPPCSLAFVTLQDRVAFGWAGPAQVELWVDEQQYVGPIIRVRDPDGREAQAIEVEAARRVLVRLAWNTRPAPAAAGVLVDALWPGRAGTPARVAGESAESEAPVWRMPSWLGTGAPWDDVGRASAPAQGAPPAPPAPAEPPAGVAPAPLPMSAPAAPPAPAPAPEPAHEVAAEPEPIRPMSAAERAAERAAELAPDLAPALAPEPPPAPLPAPEPVVEPAHEVAVEPEPIRPMSAAERAAERAAELAPPEPAHEAPPSPGPPRVEAPPPEPAQARPEPPIPPASAPPVVAEAPVTPAAPEDAPLEIIRGMEAGPRTAPPADFEIVPGAVPIHPEPAPAPVSQAEPIRPMSEAERAAQRAAELAPPEPAGAADMPEPGLAARPPSPPAYAPPPAPEPAPASSIAEPEAVAPITPAPPAVVPAPLPIAAEPPAAPRLEIEPPPPPPVPSEDAPLEIIRGMDVGPRVAPPIELDIVRDPVPIEPTALPPSLVPPVAPAATPLADAPATDDPITRWSSRIAPAPPRPVRRRAYVRRPAWPEDDEPKRPAWRRHAPLIIGILVLFSIGWLVGGLPGPRREGERGGPTSPLLDRLGFGPGHFQIVIDSHPQGAWIALDGRDLARRTPATIDAAPGSHTITLSVTNLGRARFDVHGERNGHVALDARMWGSLAITSTDNSVAVKVTVDGAPRGLAPMTVDSLAPGVHQVQFWSPGAGSWDQIVEVRVRETSQVAARPFTSPATGVLEVRATIGGDNGIQSVAGAVVWLDGEMKGHTPMRIELPRGPHSVRIAYKGQNSPVQVIDLPGGNQRFASFDLDDTTERPQLALLPLGRIDPARPSLVSAELQGLSAGDVREMWLHVSTPEGQWRSYPMSVLKAPGGAAGTAEFPAGQLDASGRALYYVSVSTRAGDELYTELQTAMSLPGVNAASTR